MNVFTFKRWWIQTFLRGKCLPTYGRGTIPPQLLSNTFLMHVTGIGGPLGVQGMTCNISWSLWLIMVMRIIVESIVILMMSVMFFRHIQILSSCLTRTFSTVLVLDSTYKTNKYRIPLPDFVGNTSTMKTFSIAFAYMMSERQDNVYWSLERYREMLHSKDLYPK